MAKFSIPERAWSWLEPESIPQTHPPERFQSLRGLGVGWNGVDLQGAISQNLVFNP